MNLISGLQLCAACILMAGMSSFAESSEAPKPVEENFSMKDVSDIFQVHVFWPDENIINSGKCDGDLIGKDVEDLRQNLNRLLRSDYRPSKSEMKNAIGLTNYLAANQALDEDIRNNDYLMLRYMTANGTQVEVQDGTKISVMVTRSDWQPALGTNFEAFVKEAAISVLNYPTNVSLQTQLKIVGWDVANGESKTGRIEWGKKDYTKAHHFPNEWYNDTILWWTDGYRILFYLSKLTEDDYLDRVNVSNPRAFFKYRRFHYRENVDSKK